MNSQDATWQDATWARLHREADAVAQTEPALASYVHYSILRHASLELAISYFLADKLASRYLGAELLCGVFREALAAAPDIGAAICRDLAAVVERDPAARDILQPFLHFKGFQALQAYRVAHWLWLQNRLALARHLQSRISEVFAVDIHPAARIGKGILIDHGTGVVIGETAVVGDDVSILHEVTLGGTGKETGDRHPKVGCGVLIGAGAKLLGNITIGDHSKVAACSVVLSPVPPHSTVAGIPAKVVGRPKTSEPALEMDQTVEHDYCI